ncbi:MAG: sulfatase [Thiocapsa sp. C3-sup]|uniref:sulfatase n=1 Tax=unclassified Thiocapsa TaxID=2641286 RepID=UPI0035B405DC
MFASLMTALPALAETGRLNVLMIMVDDLRPELGAYGVGHIETPNIDVLANEGIRFTRAYTQMATCAPSRTSLLTGLRPDTTRVTDLNTSFRTTIPGVVTLPQWFKQQGYATQGICKVYHGSEPNDSLSWSVPYKDGFGPPAPVGSDGKMLAFAAIDSPDSHFGDYKCASHAIQSIRDFRDRPFFIAVGFRKPHLPFLAPSRFFSMYDAQSIPEAENPFPAWHAPSIAFGNLAELRTYSQIPATGPLDEALGRELKRGYYAAASFVDAQIGRILAELDVTGLSNNTLVVLLGDHGFHLGEQADWGKHTNFEIGTRVPLILRGPNVAENVASSAIVELVDLYPTVVQLAGLPIPTAQEHGGFPLEGNTLVPLIEDPATSSRRGAFSQWNRGGYVGRSIRTGRYRYTEWRKTGSTFTELYDHSADPLETVNVASDLRYAEVLPILRSALAAGGGIDLPPDLLDEDVAAVPPCGEPSYNSATDTELFLWQDCADPQQWRVRFTAGGQPVSFRGSVTSDAPFLSLAGVSQEPSDTLMPDPFSTATNGSISYVQNVGSTGFDGFDFRVGPNADTCFAAAAPADRPVLLGADRVAVTSPISLRTFGACTPWDVAAVPPCGEPSYDSATDTGLFLWQDCADPQQWRVRFTAGRQPVSFNGSVTSDAPFLSLAGVSQEPSDTLMPGPFSTATNGPISYEQNVGGTGFDGFDFRVGPNADTCFAAAAPADRPVLLGADRVAVTSPISLRTFGACRP